MKLAIEALSRRHPIAYRQHGTTSHFLDGYTIDICDRGGDQIVVAFDCLQKPETSSCERLGWGFTFLARRNLSAIHVKPDKNCWYRKPQLAAFFEAAAAEGLFSGFKTVMTYGGSMGGFGALSFARICCATDCLSMNPQISLGPSVRTWETRFSSALKQDWSGELCDLGKQIEQTRTTIVYDHCFDLDRKQVLLLKDANFQPLSIPNVGHNIPAHLQTMKILGRLFDDCLNNTVDPAALRRLFRRRRQLRRYKNVMLAKAKGHAKRLQIIQRALEQADIGPE